MREDQPIAVELSLPVQRDNDINDLFWVDESINQRVVALQIYSGFDKESLKYINYKNVSLAICNRNPIATIFKLNRTTYGLAPVMVWLCCKI